MGGGVTGAKVGSKFGLVGTVVGGIAGVVGGGVGGYYVGKVAGYIIHNKKSAEDTNQTQDRT